MLALDPDVVDAVWQAFAAYLPERRASVRIRSAVTAPGLGPGMLRGDLVPPRHRLQLGRGRTPRQGGETTLRRRRDEWVAVGAYLRLADEAIGAYDRVIGLDLSEVSVDGSLHKAPCGGEGTGPNPPIGARPAGSGRSPPTQRHPVGWVTDGANRNDCVLLPATLDAVGARGLLEDIETLHLDRGYDNNVVRSRLCHERGIDDLVIVRAAQPKGTAKEPKTGPARHALAGRADQLLVVEFRPSRRNTDRFSCPPPRSARPGRRPHHHRQAHQVVQEVGWPSRRLMARSRPLPPRLGHRMCPCEPSLPPAFAG